MVIRWRSPSLVAHGTPRGGWGGTSPPRNYRRLTEIGTDKPGGTLLLLAQRWAPAAPLSSTSKQQQHTTTTTAMENKTSNACAPAPPTNHCCRGTSAVVAELTFFWEGSHLGIRNAGHLGRAGARPHHGSGGGAHLPGHHLPPGLARRSQGTHPPTARYYSLLTFNLFIRVHSFDLFRIFIYFLVNCFYLI